MGRLGVTEILVILAVVLLLFGGKKIPELMKGLGSGIKEFKNAAKDDQSADKKEEETNAEKPARKMPVRVAPKNVSYTLVNTKEWLKNNENENNLEIALAVNRTDKAFFTKMDSVIVPTDLTGDIAYYLPFPLQVSYLDKVDKILFFSINKL